MTPKQSLKDKLSEGERERLSGLLKTLQTSDSTHALNTCLFDGSSG